MEKLPEGIRVTGASTGKVVLADDPTDDAKKVFKVECTATDEQYTYLNVKMQFEAGKTYACPIRSIR